MLWPDLDLGHDPTSSSRPRPTPVTVEEARRVLIRTRLFMRDPGCGPSARIEDWISDPLPPTTPRPITPALRAVVHGLVGLDCHRIRITRDPDRICEQITALLPTTHLPTTPIPGGPA